MSMVSCSAYRRFLPFLAPGAAIVVTASLAGVTPYAIDPLYAMSKHAVVGLVRGAWPRNSQNEALVYMPLSRCRGNGNHTSRKKTEDALFMAPEDLAKDVVELMEEASKAVKVGSGCAQTNHAM